MLITPLKALANYFNEGDGKRTIREFNEELKRLTPADKLELVIGVLAITGDEISAADRDKLTAAAA
jgi:hypothetical protein